MTSHLDHLIAATVRESLNLKLIRTTDRIAEEMAEEILRDPDFRREIQALIRSAFRQAVTDLAQPHSSAP